MIKKLMICLLIIILLTSSLTFAQNIDNNTVTRAEFSKIIVELIGLAGNMLPPRDPANLLWWQSQFDDVPDDHWASRYIDELFFVMAIRGNGEGIFRPDDAILIEEAITILVRVLGSNGGLFAHRQSGYPFGYIYVAEFSGLTDGLGFGIGEYATKGLLQKLVNRALDTPLIDRRWIYPPGELYFFLADGLDGRFLSTLRMEAWNNLPVYFDGTDWILLEDDYEID